MSKSKSTSADTETTESLQLSEFLTYKISTLSNMLSREGERYLKNNYGIAIPDYRILMTLATLGEMSVREIASHSKMDKALISRVVNRLVKNKMVNSKPDPNDGRLVLLSTTKKGWDLYEELQPYAQNRQRSLLAVMEEGERQNFIKSLDKLILHMEQK